MLAFSLGLPKAHHEGLGKRHLQGPVHFHVVPRENGVWSPKRDVQTTPTGYYCGWTKSCTTPNPWDATSGIYKENRHSSLVP